MKNIASLSSYLDTTGYSFPRFLPIILSHVLYTDECLVKKVPTLSLHLDIAGN